MKVNTRMIGNLTRNAEMVPAYASVSGEWEGTERSVNVTFGKASIGEPPYNPGRITANMSFTEAIGLALEIISKVEQLRK